MNRRVVVSAMVLAAAIVASESAYASPAMSARVPIHAKFGKTKLVSFNLRNDSKEPIKVKAGETEITLEPGKLTPVKLAAGTTIVAQETTPHFPAGSVVATVTSDLSAATLSLK